MHAGRRRAISRRTRRQAGCMAKAEDEAKTEKHRGKSDSELPQADRDGPSERLKTRRPRISWCSICEGRRLHRLLRDLLRAGTSRQIRAIADGVMEALAAEGAKPAHIEGLRPIGMDAARLLRLHRPRLRARDAPLLRPRAAVGNAENASKPRRVLLVGSARRDSLLGSPRTRVRRLRPALEHPTPGRSARVAGSRSYRSPLRSATAAATRWPRGDHRDRRRDAHDAGAPEQRRDARGHRRVRRCAPGHRSRVQIRRTAIARGPLARDDARARRRRAGGR